MEVIEKGRAMGSQLAMNQRAFKEHKIFTAAELEHSIPFNTYKLGHPISAALIAQCRAPFFLAAANRRMQHPKQNAGLVQNFVLTSGSGRNNVYTFSRGFGVQHNT